MKDLRNVRFYGSSGSFPAPGTVWVPKNSVEGLSKDSSNCKVIVLVSDKKEQRISYKFINSGSESIYKGCTESFMEMFYYVGEEEKTFEMFLKMLESHTLSNQWFAYGGSFVSPYKAIDYHPRTRKEIKVKEDKGLYKLQVSFEDIKWNAVIDLTKEEALKAEKEINKHIQKNTFKSNLVKDFVKVDVSLIQYFDKEFGWSSLWFREEVLKTFTIQEYLGGEVDEYIKENQSKTLEKSEGEFMKKANIKQVGAVVETRFRTH